MSFELPKPKAVTPVPNVRHREFDKCGAILAGGQIWTYEANSTTPKITYKDPYGITPNTNPIILDANGEADIFLNGTYRFVVKDKKGVVQKDVARIGSWYSGDLDDQLKNVNDLLETSAQQLMQPLSDAINAALAAGAGANGWTDKLVAMTGGGTLDVFADTQNAKFKFIEDYYAIGGALTPVSDLYTVGSTAYNAKFKNLGDVQAVLPVVTSATDPLDWAAAQTAVNKNGAVYLQAKSYYFGNKTLEIPTTCLLLQGKGINTRIYKTGVGAAIKAKDGQRVVQGDYGLFYLIGDLTVGSIGFDASAFSYNTIRNIWIRQFHDGWFADGSTSPVNKQYSNNTIINVRSNNNTDRGFKFVGSSEANSANTYIGCEGAGNKVGFDEQVGYCNQTTGCTFQGNSEADFISAGTRNNHEFYAEGAAKSVKLLPTSNANKLSVRSTYPLWNTFVDEGKNNKKSVRGEAAIETHIFNNPYFLNWLPELPANITRNGTPIFSYFSDTSLSNGGGLQVSYNADYQGIVLSGLSGGDLSNQWVTVEFEADTSGITDLSNMRIYARDGTTTNSEAGTFVALYTLKKTNVGEYERFTFDVKFGATVVNPNILIYLSYTGTTATNIIKLKSIKVVLGQTDAVGDYYGNRLPDSSIATNLSSATSGLNTAFKRAGRIVYNSTSGKTYMSTGNQPTAKWVSLDGGVEITPS